MSQLQSIAHQKQSQELAPCISDHLATTLASSLDMKVCLCLFGVQIEVDRNCITIPSSEQEVFQKLLPRVKAALKPIQMEDQLHLEVKDDTRKICVAGFDTGLVFGTLVCVVINYALEKEGVAQVCKQQVYAVTQNSWKAFLESGNMQHLLGHGFAPKGQAVPFEPSPLKES
jgi:hypothetical protein